jgi:hypothetical protein
LRHGGFSSVLFIYFSFAKIAEAHRAILYVYNVLPFKMTVITIREIPYAEHTLMMYGAQDLSYVLLMLGFVVLFFGSAVEISHYNLADY